MVFSTFTALYNRRLYLVPKHFRHFKWKLQGMKQSLPCAPPPSQPLAVTYLLSVSLVVSVLDISYEWDRAICGLLHLTFFHLACFQGLCISSISFFLWLNNPLYAYTTYCLSICRCTENILDISHFGSRYIFIYIIRPQRLNTIIVKPFKIPAAFLWWKRIAQLVIQQTLSTCFLSCTVLCAGDKKAMSPRRV